MDSLEGSTWLCAERALAGVAEAEWEGGRVPGWPCGEGEGQRWTAKSGRGSQQDPGRGWWGCSQRRADTRAREEGQYPPCTMLQRVLGWHPQGSWISGQSAMLLVGTVLGPRKHPPRDPCFLLTWGLYIMTSPSTASLKWNQRAFETPQPRPFLSGDHHGPGQACNL